MYICTESMKHAWYDESYTVSLSNMLRFRPHRILAGKTHAGCTLRLAIPKTCGRCGPCLNGRGLASSSDVGCKKARCRMWLGSRSQGNLLVEMSHMGKVSFGFEPVNPTIGPVLLLHPTVPADSCSWRS